MKELTLPTRIYLILVYISGGILTIWNLSSWQLREPLMLLFVASAGSLALVLLVEGATERSHYTMSFIAYGFAFAYFGVPETILVILVSSLIAWLVRRMPWYIQLFNATSYIIVIQIAGLLYAQINPEMNLASVQGIIGLIASLTVFTLLNHLMVGIIVWMARGEDFKQSGIFNTEPLLIDLSLLSLGGMLVLVWKFNPWAIILVGFVIYLIYSTIRIPSLERKTVIDQKTGLFNSNYFIQQLNDELNRANRFDRPMTVIMADLDMLRTINNTYGHLAGDEVLIGVAKILKASVREYDVVSRFGGEEFTILMPETLLPQGYERAESIRKQIEEADFIVPTSVTPINVTLSLGVAGREKINQSGDEIMHNADAALYHSKIKGRNRTYAYSQDLFVEFVNSMQSQVEAQPAIVEEREDKDLSDKRATEYAAAYSKLVTSAPPAQPPKEMDPEANATSKPGEVKKISRLPTNIYISALFILSLLAFGGVIAFSPQIYLNLPFESWLGVSGCVLLLVLAESFGMDLFTRKTSLSTSAVPILAGTLLFGPLASIVLSLAYAITTGFKYRSPLSRIVFNFSNQLLVGMVYTSVIFFTGGPFVELSTLMQLVYAVVAALIVYLLNTYLISIGIHLDSGEPTFSFWKENYSWLLPTYLAMGVVSAAFIFGYKHDPLVGSLLVIVPLVLLRISQVQYVERSRVLVTETREKNVMLEKYAQEISLLNEGLFETLSDIIDLRDPYVLGHSRRVTRFATQLAEQMGLHPKQVELVRKGGLLHDIGKLGIAQEILSKAGPLTAMEKTVIKKHPLVGATLLEKSPHLRQLIPIVRQHHEYYNGKGYPDQIAGNKIALEARIIAVADAVEAMSTDRPYRSSRSVDDIISELEKCAGTQFDPMIVSIATQILKKDLNSPSPAAQQSQEVQSLDPKKKLT